MITLDDTDQEFVADTLNRAIAIHEMRMTDPNVCELNRNALAELAHALCGVVVDTRGYTSVGEYVKAEDAHRKSIRIIAELAKVKHNGVGWPVRLELADAYENCCAIAAE